MCNKLIESVKDMFSKKKEENQQERVDKVMEDKKNSSKKLNKLLREIKIKRVNHG